MQGVPGTGVGADGYSNLGDMISPTTLARNAIILALAAAVGASANRSTKGEWLPQFEMARSMCLFAAAAAEVAAIDTVFTDFRDQDGLLRYALHARRDGFSGMLAIHPAQVETINAAFEPAPEEIERARRIVDLFDNNPDAGTVGLDGRMIDRPHLVQAKRLLLQAKRGR